MSFSIIVQCQIHWDRGSKKALKWHYQPAITRGWIDTVAACITLQICLAKSIKYCFRDLTELQLTWAAKQNCVLDVSNSLAYYIIYIFWEEGTLKVLCKARYFSQNCMTSMKIQFPCKQFTVKLKRETRNIHISKTGSANETKKQWSLEHHAWNLNHILCCIWIWWKQKSNSEHRKRQNGARKWAC